MPAASAETEPNNLQKGLRSDEASLSPAGLRSAQLSPLSWAPGRLSGGTFYADHYYSSRCLGGCVAALVVLFRSA